MWCRRFSGHAWGSLALLLLHASSRIRHAAAHNMTALSFEVLDAAAIARMTVREREERGQWSVEFWMGLAFSLAKTLAQHHIPHPHNRVRHISL